MKASFFCRISMILIFALTALNAYAGLASDDEPYRYNDQPIGDGWTRWATNHFAFDFSYPEGSLGGMGVTFKKDNFPFIFLEVSSKDKKLAEFVKEIEDNNDGVTSNQTLRLTLTNGEVLSTSYAIIHIVYGDTTDDLFSYMIADLPRIGIQVEIRDFVSNEMRNTRYSNLKMYGHIRSLITYNIKKIEISGMPFYVSTRSAPTFRAIFKEIDEKFGTIYFKVASAVSNQMSNEPFVPRYGPQ